MPFDCRLKRAGIVCCAQWPDDDCALVQWAVEFVGTAHRALQRPIDQARGRPAARGTPHCVSAGHAVPNPFSPVWTPHGHGPSLCDAAGAGGRPAQRVFQRCWFYRAAQQHGAVLLSGSTEAAWFAFHHTAFGDA